MKKYINPKIDFKLFSEEKIVTDSALGDWANEYTGGKIIDVKYDDLKKIDTFKFTF